MKTIIIGGGKIGYFLLKTLRDNDYEASVIEKEESLCNNIAENIDADVICGDGTQLDVLYDAGIEEAEVVAAVTGKDEENLVICQIAKVNFNINKTIARVNNPKNVETFKALGVDKIVCSTEVIANLIENEFDNDDYKIIQTLDRGAMILVEIKIRDNSYWKNSYIKDLILPSECVIASVIRDEKVIFPRGNTQILENDHMMMITSRKALPDLKKHIRKGM